MKKISIKIYLIFFALFFISLSSYGEKYKKETEIRSYPGGATQSISSIYIKDGIKVQHGKYKEYYASGILYKEMSFKHGISHGKVTEYYPNANKKWDGNFKNGKKIGKWIFFSEDGTKKMVGAFNKKGEMISLTKFYFNGKKRKLEIYENKKLIKTLEWDIGGNLEKTILTNK